MAAPVDSARIATNITSASTSHAINVGSPVAGTLLIVFVRFAAAPGTITFTGYTALNGASGDSSDASDDTTIIFYRWADGSEGATDTLTTANSVKAAAISWEITGAQNPASSAPTVSTVAVGTTAANSANPGSVAPAGAPQDTLYLVMAGGDGEVGAYTAAPTNYTNLVVANSGTAAGAATNCFIGGASRGVTNSSSDDPGTFTHAAHTAGWTAYAVAIRLPVAVTIERSASIGATAEIASSGQFFTIFERTAAVTATADIVASAQFFSIFQSSAAVGATAAIEVSGGVVGSGASYSTIDPSRIGEWA